MQIECKTCKIVYSENNFFKDRTYKLGFKPRCKECTLKFKREWRKKKSSEIRSYSFLNGLERRYRGGKKGDLILAYLLDLSEKEEALQHNRRLKQEALLKKEKDRIFRLNQNERTCSRCKSLKHISKFSLHSGVHRRGVCNSCLWAKKQEHKLKAKEVFSFNMKLKIRERFGNKCFNCGSNERLGTDHHRPLSKGHRMSVTNAVALCSKCNSSKGDKDPEAFYNMDKLEELREKYGVE